MVIRRYEEDKVTEESYNFIVSNIILAKQGVFTFEVLLKDLRDMFLELSDSLVLTTKNVVERMVEDGFVEAYQGVYKVVILDI